MHVQGLPYGTREAGQAVHIPCLPHGQGMPHQAGSLHRVPHGARETLQDRGLHGLQAGALYEDGSRYQVCSEEGMLHSHALRAEGRLLPGSGAGLLPTALPLPRPFTPTEWWFVLRLRYVESSSPRKL